MQKLALALICLSLFGTALAINQRKFAKITDDMRCKLCKDVVQNDAKWAKLDNFKEGNALLDEAFKLCDEVFHEGMEQLEKLVCDDFATHSAPIVRERKSAAMFGQHKPQEVCNGMGFCI
ncbi:hypothetical protein M3Y97_00723200 [Aphelenchoides bicaudatus]|nr:hypothetical protein M3Y97_00723200 [Aphelenchoides bicaudatus]